MPIFEGKYDYVRAGVIDYGYQQLESTLKTPEFVELAKLYVVSTNRLRSFFELPLQLIFWSGLVSQIKFIGRYHAGLDPEDESRDDEPKVQASITAHYNQRVGNPDPKKLLDFSSNALGSMIGDNGTTKVEAACQGVEAALAAMIMTAYATFETLASDLWVCAVNRHVSLAKNWASENKSKQLTMEDIYGHGGDLSKISGTALHQTQKVTFESLKNIRTAYSHAFKGEVNDVFDCPELIMAEKTRHLFAHRGGLIDRRFKDDTSQFDEYKEVVIGERLRLTGPVTGHLINACVSRGTKLLLLVDGWSQTHL